MSDGVFGRERVALLTAEESAALDRRAQEGGIPERALMENAGRAAALVIQRLHPRGRVVAVVGSGNNGGDAIVALRSLRSWGRDVAWLPAGSRDPDQGLAAGFDLPRLDPDSAARSFAEADVLVDGILGTGVTGEPREPAATIIRRMNASGRPIVALDIPSGVDPTTGGVPGVAVEAVATIQFGWPKTGALFQPGRARCGRLIAVEIGFPPLEANEAGAAVITPGWARSRLPAREPDAHKNSVGRVTVVAGRRGMAGAAAIAGLSAMRAGAGYARIVSDDANRVIIQSSVPEALFVDRSDAAAVAEAVGECDALLVGPAIGTDTAGGELLDRVLDARGDRGAVLDADALTLLAGRDDGLRGLGARTVLTPHPGEMRRLVPDAGDRVGSDPMGVARSLAQDTGVAVLLKGAPSVVASPDGPVLVSALGSSDLATAAMGDQLGALTATFLAAGAEPVDAAGLGLAFGGRASELAGLGRSLTPRDVAAALPRAFENPGPERSSLELPFVLFDQPARW